MSNNINVCLSCDNNYSKHAAVVMASILYNADINDYIHFYILDGNIDNYNKEKILELKKISNCDIEFITVNESKFDCYKKVNTHKYITIPTYFRLKITELLPNISRIIYLDCDMIVEHSLKELFNINLTDNIIGGSLDSRVFHKKKWKNQKYINAGMIVFDLEKMRQEKTDELFEDYTHKNINDIKTGDQDIINFALKNRIKIIDGSWNVQVSGFASRTSFTKYPKIIHYIGKDKPWIFGSNTYFKDKYFKYLQLTPWKLNDKEKLYWEKENKKISRQKFWKKHPYCIIHPKYYYAFICSYF